MSDLKFQRVTDEQLREHRRVLEAKLDVASYLGVEGESLSYRDLYDLANLGILTEEDRVIYDRLLQIEFMLGER
ncbi:MULTISPECIES: hypothetical protein [unclassified Corynebacterium]|uniref:hypothetical protein n=1 Tax=unclassified Corynebacterium TaxID=2624378 RepID=UPI0029C9D39B|nr:MULTISPECIES: hypothetical protein [unclassified Corynebacterium]WPF66858.1 hypothetical protein OLX12_03800 [Corynebacterium sp. 22KM0430]WPF69346.1 hypothetical protein OLW90_03795 [Corynebacterium sp. 21KM1197]